MTAARALRPVMRLASAAMVMLTCVHCDEPAAVVSTTPAVTPPPKAKPKPPPQPSATTARVFVDLSQSMQGFAEGTEREENLEGLHRAIRSSLSGALLTTITECDMGTRGTSCGDPNVYDTARLKKKSTYNATWSPIAPAIAYVPPEAGSTAKGLMDEVDLSVFVTDGLQSTPPDKATDLPGSCVGGDDVLCLQKVLVERAKQGVGIWIVTASLPFKGWIFAEQGMAPSQFEATRAHIVEQRERWPETPMTVDKLQARNGSNARFMYDGPRPLVVFVLTRDIAKGRKVTEALVKELHAGDRSQPKQRDLASAELWPGVPNVVRFIPEIERLKDGPKAVLVLPRGATTRDPTGHLLASFDCREDGVAKLQMKVVMKPRPAGAPTLPDTFTESFEVRADGNVPGTVAGPVTLDKPGFYSVVVGCRALLTGQHDLGFDLVYGVHHQPPGKLWEPWTAPNTFAMPERVFQLQSLVDAVTATAARPDAVVDHLTIRLIRP